MALFIFYLLVVVTQLGASNSASDGDNGVEGRRFGGVFMPRMPPVVVPVAPRPAPPPVVVPVAPRPVLPSVVAPVVSKPSIANIPKIPTANVVKPPTPVQRPAPSKGQSPTPKKKPSKIPKVSVKPGDPDFPDMSIDNGDYLPEDISYIPDDEGAMFPIDPESNNDTMMIFADNATTTDSDEVINNATNIMIDLATIVTNVVITDSTMNSAISAATVEPMANNLEAGTVESVVFTTNVTSLPMVSPQ